MITEQSAESKDDKIKRLMIEKLKFELQRKLRREFVPIPWNVR